MSICKPLSKEFPNKGPNSQSITEKTLQLLMIFLENACSTLPTVSS